VRHAHSDFELVVDDSGDQVRVEISDTGAGQPMLRSPTIRERSGRGLLIVQALSDAWGSVPSTNGKMVWFSLSTRALAIERKSHTIASPDKADGPSDRASSRRDLPAKAWRNKDHGPAGDRRQRRGASRPLRCRGEELKSPPRDYEWLLPRWIGHTARNLAAARSPTLGLLCCWARWPPGTTTSTQYANPA
jgi:hypothetical protein